MDEENENNYFLFKLLLFLFIFFVIVYLSNKTGYYEYKNYTKTKLTNESILKFENDVKEGRDVSIDDYVVSEYKDYSNIITRTGSTINSICETIMNDGLKKTLKILSELFYE